ncbi:uncharacterized protein isoform X2 [Choristoneura fumiferana]|uniref:uncharacterized protein isoform X2 n=1 Tax=Choristoneura fumiferana TaxID=7141 RepID=UPI003D156BD3
MDLTEENTFKHYYYPENHDELSDDGEGTLAFKVKRAIAKNKRPNNSIHGFFEKRKKKKVPKNSSTVSQATADGVAFIKANQDESAYASHLIKIEVYDIDKIKNIPPTEQWKHAEVRVKYYAHSEEDEHVQQTRDVIYNITKQLASKSDCVNFVLDNKK